MRHIRDPITGYCIICEKNNIRHFVAPDELEGDSLSVHGQDRPRSNGRGGGYETAGKKTIHVASSSSNGSDPGNKSGKSTSLSRPSSSASLNSDDYGRQGSTSRSTSKLIIIERQGSSSPSSSRRSPNRSPSPALRSPSGKRGASPPRRGGRFPTSDPESGCFGKSRSFCGNRCCKGNGNLSKSRVFDESTNYNDGTDRCCGYRNSETASYGAGTWGIRRWCAPLFTLLVLGALAGIGAGIYFGVKAAKEKAEASRKIVNILKDSQAVYIIVGTDQQCLKNTVRPGTTTTLPYCSAITTRIVPATPRFVSPTDPDWVVAINQYSSGSEIRPLLPVVGLLLLIWAVRAILVDRSFNSGFVDTSRRTF